MKCESSRGQAPPELLEHRCCGAAGRSRATHLAETAPLPGNESEGGVARQAHPPDATDRQGEAQNLDGCAGPQLLRRLPGVMQQGRVLPLGVPSAKVNRVAQLWWGLKVEACIRLAHPAGEELTLRKESQSSGRDRTRAAPVECKIARVGWVQPVMRAADLARPGPPDPAPIDQALLVPHQAAAMHILQGPLTGAG